jgi:hypothetical protein
MLAARVRRVVVVSVAFLFKDSIIRPAYLLGRLLFPGIVADAAAMEEVFETSGLDWTIVRPAGPDGQARNRDTCPASVFPFHGQTWPTTCSKAIPDQAAIGNIIGVCN